MSGRRGGRGGGDRGGRGGRGGSNNFRGANNRNTNGNGGKVDIEALTQPTWMRAGTPPRGGGNARGDRQYTPNAFRGRGNAITNNTTATTSTSPPSNFVSNDPMNSTPFPRHEYQQRLNYLKEQQPIIKARLIANRQMEPDGQMHISQAVEKYGLSTFMCPELERVRRIAENDVKRPECTPQTAHGHRHDRVPDESRMVKAFQRPAAGMDNELMTDVRTPQTCLKSLGYMFKRLDSEGMDFLYQWIWDRSRGARKDLGLQTIKNKDVPAYLLCLEQCIRFHLLSLHYMARDGAQNYDSKIDRGNDLEQLRNSYTSLRARYEKNRTDGLGSPSEDEFSTYGIILALASSEKAFMDELNRIPEGSRKNRRIQTALEIYEAGAIATSTAKGQTFKAKQQNWVKFWSLVQSSKVSYLMACAAELYFHKIRNHILDTLRCAYRPPKTGRPAPTEDWTVGKLMYCLGLDGHEQVKEFCETYSFTFRFNSEGIEYLDVNSIPQNGELELPLDLKPQFHSARIVEPKRYGRNFSAIVLGMSVKEAQAKGLVESELNLQTKPLQETEQDEEDSLFIPETNSIGIASTNGVTSATQESANPKLNPYAPAFQPSSGSLFSSPSGPAKPNPFGTMKTNPFTTVAQNGATDTSPSFPGAAPATVRPGLFDASKNSIQFASPSAVNRPFSTVQSDNPFAKAAPNPFATTAPSAPASTSPNPFAAIATTSPPQTTQQPASQPSTPWSFSNLASGGDKVNENVAPTASISQGISTLSPSPGVSFQATSQPTASAQEKERRKAEEEKRKIEEQQRKALEEQQRIAEEQRRAQEKERQAREAAQRRIQEEQEQQRRLKEEADRRARQEQERQAREEQAARVAQQQAELRKQQERARALNGLATNLLMEPEEGLMTQLLEHMVAQIVKEKVPELENERAENLARHMAQQKRLAFIRAVCVRWVQQVEKKKKRREARRRREKLRAFRTEAEAMAGTPTAEVTAPVNHCNVDQPNGTPNGFKKPEAPASVQRQKEVSKPLKKTPTTHNAEKVSTKAKEPLTRLNQREVLGTTVGVNGINSAVTNGDYSKAYYNSTAPTDRTETDWFKLRAMGIDPSKHRKRSFGSVSSDDEKEPEVEPKRARRSTSSSFRRSLPLPPTDEERIARFRAIQQALNKKSATPRSFDGNRSVNGNSSLIIARAREMLADSPSPQYSPSSVQHEFSRSVPSVGISKPTPAPHLSMFGRSIGAAPPNERPAYWGRASRFVPQHLYGKGAEAVRAYRNQYNGRSPANSEPLALSSPIHTQQSYCPTGDTQQEYEESLDHVDHDDAHGEDEEEEEEEELIDYEDEYDEVEQVDEVYYAKDEEYYDEEDEEEMSDEEPFEQLAQKPGATQDDAIELSD